MSWQFVQTRISSPKEANLAIKDQGGTYAVAEKRDLWNEFFHRLAEDLAGGGALFFRRRFAEEKGKEVKFCFFMDVSVRTSQLLSDDAITDIVTCCQKVVLSYWPNLPDDQRQLVVLRNTEPLKTDATTAKRSKRERLLEFIREPDEGAHQVNWEQSFRLHWPGLVVSRDEALDMRMHCAERLAVEFRDFGINYRDALDEGVYLEPDLVLVGCLTYDMSCAACNGEGRIMEPGKTTRCWNNCSEGRISSGRRYLPWLLIDGQCCVVDVHFEEKSADSWYNVLCQTDIGAYEQGLTAGFQRPDNSPGFNDAKALYTAEGQRLQPRNMASGLIKDERTRLPDNSTNLGSDCVEAKLLLGEIHRLHPLYKGVRVSRVFKHLGSARVEPSFYIDVTGPGRSFCLNIKRSHVDNGVAFVLTREGISQMCYGCKEYTSTTRPCSDYVRRCLFPPDDSGSDDLLLVSESSESLAVTVLNRSRTLFAFTDGQLDLSACGAAAASDVSTTAAKSFVWPSPTCTDADWRAHPTPSFQKLLDAQLLSPAQQHVVYAFIGRSILFTELSDRWRTGIHFYGSSSAANIPFVKALTQMFCDEDVATSLVNPDSPFLIRHERVSLEAHENELLRLILAGRVPVVTCGAGRLPRGFLSVKLSEPLDADWVVWCQEALGAEYPCLLRKGCLAYKALVECAPTFAALEQYFEGPAQSQRGGKRLREYESPVDAVRKFVMTSKSFERNKRYHAKDLHELFVQETAIKITPQAFGTHLTKLKEVDELNITRSWSGGTHVYKFT